MKLKHNLSRKSKTDHDDFYRWDITIDPQLIEELKWKKGQNLKGKVMGRKLVIEKE